MIAFAQLDLVILFFFLGVAASWVKSDLRFSDQATQFMSYFLLLSLGLKGGHEVVASGDLGSFFVAAGLGLSACLMIPFVFLRVLSRRFGAADAAALAACYGSVSAVTFITAQSLLEAKSIPFSGHTVAIMAFMEIPAIPFSLFLYQKASGENLRNWKESLAQAVTNKSVVLLVGGFAIGCMLNDKTWESLVPVVKDSFKGVLAFFLLDLGTVAQRQLRDLKGTIGPVLFSAVFLPVLMGSVMMFLAHAVGLSQGDSIILSVLAGSASYIAAPAAVRAAIQQAKPGYYVALPLAVTFPFNILFGIPWYILLSGWMFKLLGA